MTDACERLRAWLLAHNPKVPPAEIGLDTDLIDSRVLDSLALVELVLYLEEHIGRPILTESLDATTLRTIRSIASCYLVVDAEAA